jgi:hypothetical protein
MLSAAMMGEGTPALQKKTASAKEAPAAEVKIVSGPLPSRMLIR